MIQRYEYTFCVTYISGIMPAIAIKEIMAMTGIFTVDKDEEQFNNFRTELLRAGLELHEIERRKIGEWEIVE